MRLSASLRTLSQKTCDSFSQFFAVLQLTLPDHQTLPALPPKINNSLLVPQIVAVELSIPVFRVASWPSSILTGVAVPETAVHQDDRSVLGQHNVGLARKVATVKAEPVSKIVQNPSQFDLWYRIGRMDLRHYFATPCLGDHVCHMLMSQTAEGSAEPPRDVVLRSSTLPIQLP